MRQKGRQQTWLSDITSSSADPKDCFSSLKQERHPESVDYDKDNARSSTQGFISRLVKHENSELKRKSEPRVQIILGNLWILATLKTREKFEGFNSDFVQRLAGELASHPTTAPWLSSTSRSVKASSSRGEQLALAANAAAVPAAWPIAITVAWSRTVPMASWVAEMFFPATNRLSTFSGRIQR